jgi:hypothetical protein
MKRANITNPIASMAISIIAKSPLVSPAALARRQPLDGWPKNTDCGRLTWIDKIGIDPIKDRERR